MAKERRKELKLGMQIPGGIPAVKIKKRHGSMKKEIDACYLYPLISFEFESCDNIVVILLYGCNRVVVMLLYCCSSRVVELL